MDGYSESNDGKELPHPEEQTEEVYCSQFVKNIHLNIFFILTRNFLFCCSN
jgi:hypothetical protein